MRRTRIPGLLAVALIGVVGALWLLLGRGPGNPVARPSTVPDSDPAHAEAMVEATLPPVSADARAPAAESAPSPAGKTLELRLHDVSGSSAPKAGHVRVSRGDSMEIEGDFRATDSLEIGKIRPGRYIVRATVDGYDSAEVELDATRDGSTVAAELCLVPKGWVGIVLRDASGRSFADWAKDWGGEPKHFFVGSLGVTVSDSAPLGTAIGTPARLQAAFDAQESSCVPRGCMGFILREPGRPVWIGLQYCGTPLESEFAVPDARSVEFVLDSSRIADLFAEVRLRVLHMETKLPAPEAKVTLLSDSSKHRRADQRAPKVGDDGVVVFPRLVPEEYELRVALQGPEQSSEHDVRLALAPGERRDLGDVCVQAAAPLRFRVVDEAGQEVQGAVVQVGPYIPGADDDTIYSTHGQPRYWSPDRNGVIAVPRPSFQAVARGMRMSLDADFGRPMPDDPSANTRIEERTVPDDVVTLVLRKRSKVELGHAQRFDGARVGIYDPLGILLTSSTIQSGTAWETMLIPGDYEARIVDPAGKELARVPFRVEAGSTTILLQ